MADSHWYKIFWVYSKEFAGREVPLVFLVNGRPGYIFNQWIWFLLEEGITPSVLEVDIRSLGMLYALCMARHGQGILSEDDQSVLVADFIDARINGTDEYCKKRKDDPRYGYLHSLMLHWPPTKKSNVHQNLSSIAKFDKWHGKFHKAPSLNPSEITFMNSYEIYLDFVNREKWDAFLHLNKTREKTTEQYMHDIPGSEEHARLVNASSKKRSAKAFPIFQFIDLVEKCNNPRDKMIVLLMGAASLRMSEPLHLLSKDIEGLDELGQAKVRLADPELGEVEWLEGESLKNCTRTEWFEKFWCNEQFLLGHPLRNLMPRTQYGKRGHGLHAGYKGMTYSDSDSAERFLQMNSSVKRPKFKGDDTALTGIADNRPYDVHHAWWIHPCVGAYFYKCFEEYRRMYIWNNPYTLKPNPLGWPYHPWLFILIDEERYGMPMTYAALRKMWDRLMKKLGLEENNFGLHSLRHLYGFYCANILGISMKTTQVLMHHSALSSTQIYYTVSTKKIKAELTTAAMKAAGANIDENLFLKNDVPKMSFPDHWTNSTHNKIMHILLNSREQYE